MSLSADVLASPVSMEPTAPHSPSASASYPSPRTPQNTPPNSANRRLVRPLLRQRKNTLQHTSQTKVGANGALQGLNPSAVSARYPEEARHERSGNNTEEREPAASPSPVNGSSALTAALRRGDDTAPTISSTISTAASPPSVTTANFSAATQGRHLHAQNEANGFADLPSPLLVRCPPLRPPSTNSLSLRATQPLITRIPTARPRPLLLPRTETPMSLESYPSNLSSNAPANSSASSSFVGTPSASKHGIPMDGPAGPKLSSPSTALPGRRNVDGVDVPLRAAPPLLRSSLSTHTLHDDACPSSASSYATRVNLNALVGVSPRPRVGPLPPHVPSSATSVASGGATPLSSTRSSARPSFLRMVVPAASATPADAGKALDVASLQTKENGDGSVLRAVNGRVLPSPHSGARRPELSARRTTFHRSASAASFNDGPSSSTTATKARGDSVEASHCAADGGVGSAMSRGEPALNSEMRTFVLGQYRTLQREVLTLPTSVESARTAAQTDVSAVDFVHVKKSACPQHSKAARRAELKRQEAERLLALQQQHHDLEVIRNGGREQIGVNMKSSTMLAGSLSKLRSRGKSGVHGGTERVRNSLDRTISAAFESDGSPFGFQEAEEASETAMYGLSPEKPTPQQRLMEGVEDVGDGAGALMAAASTSEIHDAEAWHSSKFFMAATRTPSFAETTADRRGGRTVNKNGMKGEAIVVAVMPDSDDEDEETEEDERRGAPLRRTKGAASEGGTNGSSAASWRTAAPALTSASPLRDVTTSAATSAGAVRQVGSASRLSRAPRGPTRHADNDRGGSSSSSDDDACFSFNKLRSQRLRSSTLSLSFSQPLDQKNLSTTRPLAPPKSSAQSPDRASHRPGKMLSPSKESSSSDMSEEEEEGEGDACCFCCPCKRPENFFALCRTSSQSGSFVATQQAPREPQRLREPSPVLAVRQHASSPLSLPNAEAGSPPRLRHGADVNAGSDSRVVLEDLEAVNDDDEPLLSMQSFRRTSIQRVR